MMSSTDTSLSPKLGEETSNGLAVASVKESTLVSVEDANDDFCVTFDADVLMEEVVEESTELRANGLRCDKMLNEVIYIDDSDDDMPHNANYEVQNSLELLHRIEDDYMYSLDSLCSDVHLPRATMPTQNVSLINEVLSDLGLKLILYRIFSSLEGADTVIQIKNFDLQKDSVSFLDIPRKYCKCGFASESVLVFNSHVNVVDNIHLKCCLCSDFKTKRVSKLAAHMSKVHDVPEQWAAKRPPHQCGFCDYDTNSRSILKRHSRSCMSRFVLNNNLAPRPELEELRSYALEKIPTSRNFSVIYPNPRRTPWRAGQRSVIVANASRRNEFSGLAECGYCKASVKDLESLGRHMEVVHRVQYSFERANADSTSAKSSVVVLDEDSNNEQIVCSKNDKEGCLNYLPGSRSRSGEAGETDVETELAKMTVRKECLWCLRKFETLEMFEEHMVGVHDDLKCDVRGFWNAIESGLTECSGLKMAAAKECPWCSVLFQHSSSCHRHILSCHWDSHLDACDWCNEITSHSSPYLLKVNLEGNPGKNGMDVNDDDVDNSSSSSFLSDIDAKEVAT